MVTSFLNRFAPINFDRYIDRLTDRFTGREWLFEQHIDPWLQQQGKEQFYLLTGEPGVGKSAIVAQLVKRWKAQPEDAEQGILAAYHFCRAGDVETVRPGRVLRSIAAQLGETLPHYGKALNKVLEQVHLNIDVNININSLTNSQVTGIYIENLKDLDPREELRLLIQAPLAELPKIYEALPEEEREKLPTLKVFLIDSLDEAVTTTGRDNVATLLAALSQTNDTPPWIRFILTARPGILKANAENGTALQFKSLQHYELEKLLEENLTDVEWYITRRTYKEIERPKVALMSLWQEYREFQKEQTEKSEKFRLFLSKYTTHLITRSKHPQFSFQKRLEQAELSTETLIQQVKNLSKGNFLYTRLVMNGVSTGELPLKNLSALPKNLYEVYQRFLRHRCPVRKWVHLYQPILGTLTVTQEAVSTAQLTKFAMIASKQIEGDAQVENGIGILRQFLDEVEDEQGQKLYIIFHQSLREYLLDRKRNHDFWCDAKEQHDNIIKCCEQESKNWEDLRAIDLYGLRHLVQHLVKANKVKQLHELLIREKDERNAWFDAKDWRGEITSFIADVKTAWDYADDRFEQEPDDAIAQQCMYGLMIASVNSLADRIPVKLLIALLDKQVWTPQKVLGYLRQIPDQYTRIQTTVALATYLPPAIQRQALQEAIHIVLTVSGGSKKEPAFDLFGESGFEDDSNNEQLRANALSSIATVLPANLLPEALQVVSKIQRSYRPAIIRILVQRNPYPEILPELRQAVMDIIDEHDHANALADLACHIPEVLPQALEATLKIDLEYNPNDALLKLINRFPHIFPQALQSALIFFDSHSSSKLADLAKHLPETYLSESIEISKNIEREFARTQFLKFLAERLPETLFFNFIESTETIQNHHYRIQILTKLVDRFPESTLQVLLETPFLWSLCSSILNILVDKIPMERYSDLTPIALEIIDEAQRIKVLEKISKRSSNTDLNVVRDFQAVNSDLNLSDDLEEVPSSSVDQLLQAVLDIQEQFHRTDELIALANRYPHIIPKIFQNLPDSLEECSKILKALARSLPTHLFAEALKLITRIPDRNECIQLIEELAERLSGDLLIEALRISQKIQDVQDNTLTLSTLLNNCSAEDVLQILQDIEYDTSEIEKVFISADLSIEEFNDILPIAGSLIDGWGLDFLKANLIIREHRAHAWVVLAKKSSELLPEALQAIQAISRKEAAVYALISLAEVFSDLIPQVLTEIYSLYDISRKEAWNQLIERVPKAIPLILEQIKEIKNNEHENAQILCFAARSLPNSLLPKFLSLIEKFEYEPYRTQVLSALAIRFPEIRPEVVERALSIDEQYRAEALVAIVDLCPETLLQAIQAVEAEQYGELKETFLNKSNSIFLKAFQALLKEKTFLTESFILWLDELPEFYRAKAICILADHLPSDLLPTAVQSALAIQDHEQERNNALIALADKTPEAAQYVLQFIPELSSEAFHVKALVDLAVRSPDILPLALESALKLTIRANSVEATLAGYQRYDRVDALRDLAQKFPAVLPQALQAAQEIRDRRERFEALFALATVYPEVLPQALNAAQAIVRRDWHMQALDRLVPYLGQLPYSELANFWKQILRASCLGTRQELFQDISTLAPVILSLGNSASAMRVVSTIQRVCGWWP